MTARRRRLDPDQSRTMILDAVGNLMRREGYAAISARRVAAEAGLKAPLVHYYYATLDDLLLAFYWRSTERARRRLSEALASDRPLHAIWKFSIDPEVAELGAEFMALANHRAPIRDEVAKQVEAVRSMQTEVFQEALHRNALSGEIRSPDGAALLLAAVARALVMEERVGVLRGHSDAKAFIEGYIGGVESRSDRTQPRQAGREAAESKPLTRTKRRLPATSAVRKPR